MSKLSVYYADESEAYAIAESKAQAHLVLFDHGLVDEESDPAEELVRCDDDNVLRVLEDNGTMVTKTCREWCESNGPGFLCGPMD